MSIDTTSADWHRVATLRPSLRSHVRVHRHVYRQQPWYILEDTVAGACQRLPVDAWRIVGLFDGEHTVEAAWESAVEQLGDDAPVQAEVVRLLADLNAASLIATDASVGGEDIARRRSAARNKRWRARLVNPISQNFALANPAPLLDLLAPVARLLLRPWAFVAWCLAMLAAALLAAMHWPALLSHFDSYAWSARSLGTMAVVYPALKFLHELGHGLATRARGGDVNEMGIMFLVLMPIPYVNASAAATFENKLHRMAVGAAGIMVELLAAAVALVVWTEAQPGLVRDIAFSVMLIGSVSTLLFNGNPLLKFDGYYVLSDAIEMPNLADRAKRYLRYFSERHVFGMRDVAPPSATASEAVWLFCYGVASAIYRVVILGSIALYIASKFFVVGVVLACWVVATQVLWPLAKFAGYLLTSPALAMRRTRALGATALAGLVVAAVAVAPLSNVSHASGIVWLPERAYVRASADGFVEAMDVQPHQSVETGDTLMALRTHVLASEREVLEARRAELRARYTAQARRDRAAAEKIKDDIATVDAEIAAKRAQRSSLAVRSPLSGTFVPAEQDAALGRFVQQGDLLGFVLDDFPVVVRTVLPQADVALVREQTRAVQVRFAGAPNTTLQANIEREVAAAKFQLPGRALGTAGGGQIPVDPADESGLTTLQPVFSLDLGVPGYPNAVRFGERVFVQFEHDPASLAQQLYRGARQVFLRRFGV